MTQLKPKVGIRSAIFLVVSVIIGSGVFKKIALMSQELGSPSLVLLCWIAAGLISLAGALLMQGIWAILLVFSGTFDQLTDMLVFAAFIFYGTSALSVSLMRMKHPEMERTYKAFGYPYTPALFYLFSLGLFIMTILNQPKEALWGLVLIGSGIPFYIWFKGANPKI